MNRFGEAIRQHREEKNLLLRQLAAQLEIDTALLSKIERGERNAKRDQVNKLSVALGIEFNVLISLWLADRVCNVLEGEEMAKKSIEIVIKEIK